MAKPRKITRATAAEAKTKLEQFCVKIDEYDALGKDDPNNAQPWKGPDPKRRADAERARSELSDWLHQQAHDVARLLEDVRVQHFYAHSPEAGRTSVQRAIGEYARIAAGGAPPAPPTTTPAEPSGKQRWWMPLLIAITGSSAATAAVNAAWGTAVRCEPNREFDCRPYGGVEYAQRCNPNGVGRTLCVPLSELRQVRGSPRTFLLPTPQRQLPDGGTSH